VWFAHEHASPDARCTDSLFCRSSWTVVPSANGNSQVVAGVQNEQVVIRTSDFVEGCFGWNKGMRRVVRRLIVREY
jgi:hypothetical protein